MTSIPATNANPQPFPPPRVTKTPPPLERRPPVPIYGMSKGPILRALRASQSVGSRRNVLVALLLLGNGAELVQERQYDIAAVAGCSIDVTRGSLRDLRRMGEIERIRGEVPGTKTINIYRIRLPLGEGV